MELWKWHCVLVQILGLSLLGAHSCRTFHDAATAPSSCRVSRNATLSNDGKSPSCNNTTTATKTAEWVATRILTREGVSAVKTITNILLAGADSYGIVDVFNRYRRQDVLMSAIALGRLQEAAKHFDSRKQHFQEVADEDLLEELAYFAVFANAAYGWVMNLLRLRLHLGDLRTLLRRTGIPREDVVVTKFESRAHRPAYFVVRDSARKTIVLCVRGTWSAHDMLTNLCCTAEEFDPVYASEKSSALDCSIFARATGKRLRAHHGMLEAAVALQSDVQPILREEMVDHPDFRLVLVGHSLGGGVAALLGTLLESTFPSMRVYIYGAPCISPESCRLDEKKIFTVIREGDPFSCLSLGHIADVSIGLAYLCEDPILRSDILMRTNSRVEEMNDQALEWCSNRMQILQNRMTSEKLYPPGRILLLSGSPRQGKRNGMTLRQVPRDHFRELAIGPRMFDLSRHVPSLYESYLRALAESNEK